MDEIVEGILHALFRFLRVLAKALVEVVAEVILGPLMDWAGSVYRASRDRYRAVFRFDILALPLAILTTVALFGIPIYIVAAGIAWIVLT